MTDLPRLFRTESERQPVSKEPYDTPQLTVHGKIEDVTLNLNPGSAEGIAGSKVL